MSNKSNIINVWYVYQTENIMEMNGKCKEMEKWKMLPIWKDRIFIRVFILPDITSTLKHPYRIYKETVKLR